MNIKYIFLFKISDVLKKFEFLIFLNNLQCFSTENGSLTKSWTKMSILNNIAGTVTQKKQYHKSLSSRNYENGYS